MQFLYPKFLWALLTLVIPVIIHLFNFRKYKTVYFSNVAFLQNIKKDTKSQSTLKNLLLLMVRMLAIIFIVLVFAHPYIPNNKNQKVEQTQHVAIYIDNSFSMDAEGKTGILLEAAKIKAKEITVGFPVNTKYLLLTNDFLPVNQRFVSSDRLIEQVSQIKSSHIVRTQNEIIDKFTTMLPQTDSNSVQNVFILSDFQKNTAVHRNINTNKSINIFAVLFKNQTQNNIYIDSVWFETPGHYKGKQEKLFVNIKNVSAKAFVEIPLQLYLNDTLKTSVVFNIDAKTSKKINIPFTIQQAGLFKGLVKITDYPITFDNNLYFNFTVEDKKNVLVVTDKNSKNYFEALFNNDNNVSVKVIDINRLKYNDIQKYQVAILNEISDVSTGLISEIINFSKSGGTVVFIPDSAGNITSYNSFLNQINVKINNIITQKGSFSNIDFNNNLFKQVFKTDLKDVKMPEYSAFFPLTLNNKTVSNTIIRTESGNPLFVEIKNGKGKIFISALPVDTKISDFAIHPLFVPLFYNIALYSTSSDNLYYRIKPGLYSTVALQISNNKTVEIEEITTKKRFKPKHHTTLRNITVYPDINTLNAGYYAVYSGESLQNYISYNYDIAESDIEYLTKSEIEKIYNNYGVKNISILKADNKNIEKNISEQSNGKSLTMLFLWLTLLMLVLEIFVIKFKN